MTAADALFSRAAKLPRVAIERPAKVIGTSTIAAMQSGLFYGYASLIDGLIERMIEEMHDAPKVIATGGLARLMEHASKYTRHIDENLTLDGSASFTKKLELLQLFHRNRRCIRAAAW